MTTNTSKADRQPANGEVYVEVSGLTGVGKSGVAGEIEIAMRALGLDVVWEDSENEKRLTHADWIGALEMYKPRVVIRERNISRAHLTNAHPESAARQEAEPSHDEKVASTIWKSRYFERRNVIFGWHAKATALGYDGVEELLAMALPCIVTSGGDERATPHPSPARSEGASEGGGAEAREDAKLIDWLRENELSLVTHQEAFGVDDPDREYSIWWRVVRDVTRGSKARSVSGHPVGCPREAIRAAIAASTSGEGRHD